MQTNKNQSNQPSRHSRQPRDASLPHFLGAPSAVFLVADEHLNPVVVSAPRAVLVQWQWLWLSFLFLRFFEKAPQAPCCTCERIHTYIHTHARTHTQSISRHKRADINISARTKAEKVLASHFVVTCRALHSDGTPSVRETRGRHKNYDSGP